MSTPGVRLLLTSKEGGDKDANVQLGLVAAFSRVSGQDAFCCCSLSSRRGFSASIPVS